MYHSCLKNTLAGTSVLVSTGMLFFIALPVGHPAGYKARLFWPVFLECSEGGRAFSFACVVSNKSPAGIVKKALAGGGGGGKSSCHGGRRRREIGFLYNLISFRALRPYVRLSAAE